VSILFDVQTETEREKIKTGTTAGTWNEEKMIGI
jgi:hypothetical protein